MVTPYTSGIIPTGGRPRKLRAARASTRTRAATGMFPYNVQRGTAGALPAGIGSPGAGGNTMAMQARLGAGTRTKRDAGRRFKDYLSGIVDPGLGVSSAGTAGAAPPARPRAILPAWLAQEEPAALAGRQDFLASREGQVGLEQRRLTDRNREAVAGMPRTLRQLGTGGMGASEAFATGGPSLQQQQFAASQAGLGASNAAAAQAVAARNAPLPAAEQERRAARFAELQAVPAGSRTWEQIMSAPAIGGAAGTEGMTRQDQFNAYQERLSPDSFANAVIGRRRMARAGGQPMTQQQAERGERIDRGEGTDADLAMDAQEQGRYSEFLHERQNTAVREENATQREFEERSDRRAANNTIIASADASAADKAQARAGNRRLTPSGGPAAAATTDAGRVRDQFEDARDWGAAGVLEDALNDPSDGNIEKLAMRMRTAGVDREVGDKLIQQLTGNPDATMDEPAGPSFWSRGASKPAPWMGRGGRGKPGPFG